MDSGGLGSASGSIELDASKAIAALTQVSTGLRNLDSQSRSQGHGLLSWANQHEQSLRTIGTGMTGIGVGIMGAFGFGVKGAMDFESAMSSVRAVAGATDSQFQSLSDAALRIGKDTSFSATEAASAIEELVKAGVSVEDVLNGAADGAVALAAAAGIDMPSAATAMANSMNIFGLSGDQATRVANVFAAAANKSATDVHQLQLGLAQGGATFAMFGMSLEESVGALALFSDYGIRGSDAATSLNAAFRAMASGTGESGKAMDELGISLYDAQGQFIGVDGVASQLTEKLGHMSEEERNLYLQRLGGADGMRALNILYTEGAEGVNEYTDAVTGTNAAEEAARIRMDNLAGVLEQIKGSLETLAITLMGRLLPALSAFGTAIATAIDFLINLPGPIQTAIVAATGLVGTVSLLGGGFLLLLPRIAETRKALQDLGGVSGILHKLSPPIGNLSTSLRTATANAGGLRGALMGLVRAHPALLGLGLIAGGLYAAYRTNFLGIGDLIDGVAGKVKSVFADMSAAFNASGESASVAADDVATFAEATDVVDGVTVYTAFKTNAAGEKEAVGEIIESYKNADGMTAQVLIKGEDGEYWATIDLATGEISNAEIPVTANTKPFSDRLNDALQVLEDRFSEAGMGWAASVVDNIQGIVSTVSNMANKLRTVFTALSPRVKDFLSQIAAATVVLAPLGAGIGLVVRAFSTLSPVLTMARVAIQGIGLAIAVLTSPIGLIVVGIAALAAGLVFAYQNFETFRNVVDSVVDTVKGFWDAISSGEALATLQQMSDSLQQWFQDTADRIMSGISDTWDAITSSVTDALNGARNIVASIWSGISSGVGAAWDAIQNGISLAWNAITSLNWSDWINPLNWADWIVGKIEDFAGWVWDQIKTYFPAAALITNAIGDFTSWIWGKIETYFPSASLITDAIGNFKDWIWGKISTYFPSASVITDAIGNFKTWIWEKIGTFFPSSDLITGAIGNFGDWLYEKIGSPSISIPDFPGWSAFFDWINPLNDGGGTDGKSSGGAGRVSQLAPPPRTNEPYPGTTPDRTPNQGQQWSGGAPVVTQLPNTGSGPGGAFAGFIAQAQTALEQITTILGQIQVAVASGLSSIVSAFTSDYTQVQVVVASAMSSTSSAMTTGMLQIQVAAASGLTSTVSAFTTAFLQVQLTTASAMSSTSSAVTTGMLMIQSTAASGLSSTASAFTTGFLRIQTTVASAMSSVNSAVTTGMLRVQTTTASAMSSTVSAVSTAASRMTSEMQRGASGAASAVQSALSRIPGIVSSMGSSAAATARSAGANISNSFASGMLSALGTIQAAAAAMVAAADAAVRARARIASPSKMAQYWADMIGVGFVGRLGRYVRDTRETATALVDALTRTMRGVTADSLIPALEAATTTPKGIAGQLVDTLSGITNGLLNDSLIPALQQAVNASQLSGYGSSVTPAYAYATAPPAPVVTHVNHAPVTILTVPPDEWIRIAREAERGGTYAKTMSQNDAFTQYLGGD